MKLIDVLFCDDIRVEMNNKVSLMGLYNDRIVFRSHEKTKLEWPIKMDLAMLVRLNISDNEKKPISFAFECFSNDKSIVKIDGNTDISNFDGSVFCLILSTKNIDLNPGDLGYSIKVWDEKTEHLSQINKKAIKVLSE